MPIILDGRVVRDSIKTKLAARIGAFSVKPKLAILQIGSVANTEAYVRQKKLFGESIGALVEHRKYEQSVSEESLLSDIQKLNADTSVHGIILQIPIPAHLDKNALIEAIDPKKDVDGLHSKNLKLQWEHNPSGFVPATARGILTLLDHYKIPISGKHVVVIGRSSLVGKPTALALLERDATVTVCHSKTENLAEVTRRADILVVAAGHPNLITSDFVSDRQTVIDVGINLVGGNKLEEEIVGGRLVGDVDFEPVSKVVHAISPVPGGVGPMTVASLFENLLAAYENLT